MKKLFLSLCAVCLLFSCEKEQELIEASSEKQNINQSSNTSNENFTLKSGGTLDIDDLALAANIASIGWDGASGLYVIDSHDDALQYTVDIDFFKSDSLIEFDINVSSGTPSSYTVEIDVDNETIDVTNLGSFTFANFYGTDDALSPSDGTIKGIIAVISVFHEVNAQGSDSWDDNGDGDDLVGWKFWGWEITYGPCGPGDIRKGTEKYYMFGIPVYTNTDIDPIPC